jgi:hypothetical protein
MSRLSLVLKSQNHFLNVSLLQITLLNTDLFGLAPLRKSRGSLAPRHDLIFLLRDDLLYRSSQVLYFEPLNFVSLYFLKEKFHFKITNLQV